MIPWYPQQCGRCNELTNGMTEVGDVGASSTCFFRGNQTQIVIIGLASFRVHNSIGRWKILLLLKSVLLVMTLYIFFEPVRLSYYGYSFW